MKILVGYDPPYHNSALLQRTILDARAYDAYVYLVTSFQDGREATPDVVDSAQEALNKAMAILRGENILCESHVLVRNTTPGEDIVAFAMENDVDEIIVHAKKKSKVGKVITGSNAQHIILNAHCTVLTVK